MNPSVPLLAHRYHLLDSLGTGGMGVVYRAYDRLTQQTIALKQVTIAPENLHFNSRSAHHDTAGLLLALAQEFKVLASLHHPNIISVLDYGFDINHQPYFTMELLPTPQTLLEAGQGQPLTRQIDLLVQTLQALAYLHRRRILHRDLKPANVLVSQGQVRVLDFGLAVGRDQATSDDVSGTLLYLAPEILEGASPSEATDLYAVGVLAYELFTGQPPFQSLDPGQLLLQILDEDPDLTPLDGLTPAGARRTLPAILLRLLSKQPALRYPSAEAVIVDLYAVLNQPPPPESVAIRESFLQAATFVGRAQEMAQLTAALTQALQGQGSAWLIGGESGVGKSRLLEEVRTQALVAGALVLRGQAVEGGGLPYQLWRELLRRLTLSSELSDLDASILKSLVPDIANLLERPIADAPELQGQANQQRLLVTIAELLKRQHQPLILLLEDLQWASESLVVLQFLLQTLEQQPLLVLATYRDDERPNLPAELASANLLRLERLSEEAVAQLSTAMLGEVGKQPQVVELLQRESEGNTFFMVEVVRALAEEAGQLSAIDHKSLPQRILAGGMQQVIQRRLARVPAWAQPALQLAAVAGRQLDAAVLTNAMLTSAMLTTDKLDWEAWVTACAHASVLDIVDGNWRFAHDKLREQLLLDLREEARPSLHQQVAQAIEQVYPNEVAYAEVLADHWQAANAPAKVIHYVLQASQHLLFITADYPHAEALIQRGLALDNTAHEATFYQLWGELKIFQSDYPNAINHFQTSLAATHNNAVSRAVILNGLCEAHWRLGNYSAANQYIEQALSLARSTGDQRGVACSLGNLAILNNIQGHFAAAATYSEESLQIWRALNSPRDIAHALTRLGICYADLKKYAEAQAVYDEALQIQQQIGDRAGASHTFSGLGIMADYTGQYAAASQYYRQGLAITRAIGDWNGTGGALLNLAITQLNQDDLTTAHTYLTEGLAIMERIGKRMGVALSHSLLGLVASLQEEFQTAYEHFNSNLLRWRELDAPDWIARTQANLAFVLLGQGEANRARSHMIEALQMAVEQPELQYNNHILEIAAFLFQTQGDAEPAAQWVGFLQTDAIPHDPTFKIWSKLLRSLEQKLGNERFVAALAHGKTLEQTTVMRQALDAFRSSNECY